jgi:hypothetical protein
VIFLKILDLCVKINVPYDFLLNYNIVDEGQNPDSELKTILVPRKKQKILYF